MMPVYISCAVEGQLDTAVAERLLRRVGAEPAATYPMGGKHNLRDRLRAFNHAAQHAPWFVLVDLDDDAPCGPALRSSWLPEPAALMCFRAAVRAVEAWILGDAEAVATLLRVPSGRLPSNPDGLEDPKDHLVHIATRSGSRDVRRAFGPRPGSGARVGPEYTGRLVEFVSRDWRPEVAASRSPSLAGCIASMARLVDRGRSST